MTHKTKKRPVIAADSVARLLLNDLEGPVDVEGRPTSVRLDENLLSFHESYHFAAEQYVLAGTDDQARRAWLHVLRGYMAAFREMART